MGLTACTLPSPKSHKYCLSPHLFGAASQCYLSAVSSAIIFILPPVKLNFQLACCFFFFKSTQFSYRPSETTVFWFISRCKCTARIDQEGSDQECSATVTGSLWDGLARLKIEEYGNLKTALFPKDSIKWGKKERNTE